MTEYILTERLSGDYEGKLAILHASKSESDIKKKKEAIIKARLSKPLFGAKWDRKTLENQLEIWHKIP
jgi:hypothetical protein